MKVRVFFWFALIVAISTSQVSGQLLEVPGNDSLIFHAGNFHYGTVQWEQSTDLVNWEAITGANDTSYQFFPTEELFLRAALNVPDCETDYSDTCHVLYYPEVQIDNPTQVSINSITLNAIVIKDGGAAVFERGVCWNTIGNPSISDSFEISGSGLGSFQVAITGLAALTTYHLKAYAINEVGIDYSDEILVITDTSFSLYPGGTVFCKNYITPVVEVLNPLTGKVWMDRNLGAQQVAQNTDDSLSYGDLYQWGRFADGHQCRNSSSTTSLSSGSTPGNNLFIITSSTTFDWSTTTDTSLWQGTSGLNNPCPTGFRIATAAEWQAERQSWSNQNASGALNSVLKLSAGGWRSGTSGNLSSVDTMGVFWSSTNSWVGLSTFLEMNPASSTLAENARSGGFSVRCIKDTFIVLPPNQPAPIIGPLQPCENDSGLVYSVDSLSEVSYTWSVPADWIIVEGQGTASVVVVVGSNGGMLSVTPSNSGGTGPPATLSVMVTTLPDSPMSLAHLSGSSVILWNWQSVTGADGYLWHHINQDSLALDVGSSTVYSESALACDSSFVRYVWAYNACGVSKIPTVLNDSTELCFNSTYPAGSIFCDSLQPTPVQEVISPHTGRIWMDRNLGAVQSAVSLNDTLSFGDLYQWGRFADGHQCRNSDTISQLSSANQPQHAFFILATTIPYDWRNPQNNMLWQGLYGDNNPCPLAYRIPSEAEFADELSGWTTPDLSGAFNSSLKLSPAGFRNHANGWLLGEGMFGNYWTSNLVGTNARVLTLNSSLASINTDFRAAGASVRCIKDSLGVVMPNQPDSILGALNPCAGDSGIVYQVVNQPGVTYTWTVPSDWSILAGQGSYSITVVAGTSSGLMSVAPSNTIGTSMPQNLWVNPIFAPTAPLALPSVIGLNFITWSWNEVSDAEGYKWSTVNDISQATDLGNDTSYTELVSQCDHLLIRYVWAYNACGISVPLTLSDSTINCAQFVSYPEGSVHCNAIISLVVEVTNPLTGKVWMDRNVGAQRVALHEADLLSMGDLYQWGRFTDGHQCRTSTITQQLSPTDTPNHPEWIATNGVYPHDWRMGGNDLLWQGLGGINNPCPTGFRLPTKFELQQEMATWSSQDSYGAMLSPLKLPSGGWRSGSYGNLVVGMPTLETHYWTSSPSGTYAWSLILKYNNAFPFGTFRSRGGSIRCIKDM